MFPVKKKGCHSTLLFLRKIVQLILFSLQKLYISSKTKIFENRCIQWKITRKNWVSIYASAFHSNGSVIHIFSHVEICWETYFATVISLMARGIIKTSKLIYVKIFAFSFDRISTRKRMMQFSSSKYVLKLCNFTVQIHDCLTDSFVGLRK